jgi:hypothetical protein
MGTGSFPGVKRPGRGGDHPLPSSAEVKKEYSYTSPRAYGSVTGYHGLVYFIENVVSTRKTNCLMLYREIFAVCCKELKTSITLEKRGTYLV